MKVDPVQVALTCLFCGCNLQAPENAQYSSGDLIKCQGCGEHNDYDSVVEVAKEMGIAQLAGDIEKQLAAEIRKIFGK